MHESFNMVRGDVRQMRWPCSLQQLLQNAEAIRRIKEKTKDWHWGIEYGNLCPECYKEILETRGEQT